VSRSLTTECTLKTQENLRDEIPKIRRLWPTSGCNAMEEEEEERRSVQIESLVVPELVKH
jgi:hypothetical protein